MKKQGSKHYGLFFVTLLLLTSFPRASVDHLRGSAVAFFSPFWGSLEWIKNKTPLMLQFPFIPSNFKGAASSESIQALQLQNQLLKTELLHLRELYQHERFLNVQLSHLKYIQDHQKKDLEHILALQLEAIPAQVIFRSPSLWNNSLWINVGEMHSEHRIVKNSPVLVGNSVVGVIDFVGKHQSRVRLITDPGLNPSVRATRGQLQDKTFLESLEGLISYLQVNEPILSSEELSVLHGTSQKLKKKFEEGRRTWRLAKGELCGTCSFQSRGSSLALKGTGFNYDFADEQGPARDLRSGVPLNDKLQPAMSIIKINDLLVTTGMDGIFPPGLEVARVTGIQNLQEGDYFYEIEAVSTVGDLNQLSTVFVIPPYAFEEKDRA